MLNQQADSIYDEPNAQELGNEVLDKSSPA